MYYNNINTNLYLWYSVGRKFLTILRFDLEYIFFKIGGLFDLTGTMQKVCRSVNCDFWSSLYTTMSHLVIFCFETSMFPSCSHWVTTSKTKVSPKTHENTFIFTHCEIRYVKYICEMYFVMWGNFNISAKQKSEYYMCC